MCRSNAVNDVTKSVDKIITNGMIWNVIQMMRVGQQLFEIGTILGIHVGTDTTVEVDARIVMDVITINGSK